MVMILLQKLGDQIEDISAEISLSQLALIAKRWPQLQVDDRDYLGGVEKGSGHFLAIGDGSIWCRI